MLEHLILTTTVFLVLIIGTYSDFLKREVPDWLSYGSIVLGLGLSFILALISQNWALIAQSVLGGLIFTAIAFAMFYLGQWGGGDSKILMGLGALIGLNWQQVQTKLIPDLITFLILIMFVGGIYGLFWSFFLAVSNSKNFKKKFEKISAKYSKLKRILLLSVILLVLISLFMPHMVKILMLVIVLVAILSFYIWLYAKAIEDSAMLRYINPGKLVEGDWVAEDVKIDGKKIVGPSKTGIEREDIDKLVKLYKNGKVKKVLVKEGIPFVPSFLLSYLILVLMNYFNIALIDFIL